jgi:hypothetical protein
MSRIRDTAYGVLLGPSMSGKTRLIFETCCQYYGIYLSLNPRDDRLFQCSKDLNLDLTPELILVSEILTVNQRRNLLQRNMRCLISARLCFAEIFT